MHLCWPDAEWVIDEFEESYLVREHHCGWLIGAPNPRHQIVRSNGDPLQSPSHKTVDDARIQPLPMTCAMAAEERRKA